jgi:hypothetical protein
VYLPGLALLVSEIIEIAIEGAVRRRQNAGVADHIGVGKVGDHQIRGVVENCFLDMRIARCSDGEESRAVPPHLMYMASEITIPDSTTSDTSRMQGSTVSVFLRLDGLAAAALSALLFARASVSWWLFALLWLTPDLSMLGYLAGPAGVRTSITPFTPIAPQRRWRSARYCCAPPLRCRSH